MPTDDPPPTPDEVRAALQMLLCSPSFEGAPRLRDFLKYVSDLTLAGEAAGINEYLIGREVFERGEDYAPGDDGVVRRQAHALRQKLFKYYASEGATAKVRIELPLGRYVPTFRYTEAPKAASENVDIPASTQPEPKPPVVKPGRRQIVAAAAGGSALLGIGIVLGRAISPAPRGQSDLASSQAFKEIWGAWVGDPVGVTLCFSNPKTAALRQIPGGGAESGHRVVPGSDADRSYRQAFQWLSDGDIFAASDTSSGKVMESYAGVRLGGMFASQRVTVRSTQSRLLSWEILRRENVILFGHEENNRWVSPLLEKMPLRISGPTRGQPRQIVQVGPKGIEPLFQNSHPQDAEHAAEQFALISMLPGPAAGRKIALIAGLFSPASDMAAEFLSTPEGLEELAKRLKTAAPRTTPPWYFQAVLRAEVRDRLAMRGTIVALRLLSAEGHLI